MIASTNPATGRRVFARQADTDIDVDGKLDAAVRAQSAWRHTPVGERAALLSRIAAVLRDDSERLARLITSEMGKPVTQSLAEIEKCAATLDYYADAASQMLAPLTVDIGEPVAGVTFEPLGVVLAVMPWNYPFWQYFRFAAPALAAGNAPLLKHASNVPGCADAIEEAMRVAGAPAGLCPVLFVSGAKVAEVIADPRVAAVSLTGSTAVGRLVAEQAGRALKKQVLELGGSDPFIIMADADIEAAARAAVKARFTNGGQSCVNAKRFIVDDAVADRFVDAFIAHTRRLKIGDPQDPATDIGPMARQDLLEDLHDQVCRTLEAPETELRIGGAPLPETGCYYPPTIIDRVSRGDVAFEEETFGPVAAVIRARNAEHAIELANATEYGLAAAIWSSDTGAARAISQRLDVGAVFINAVVASDPRLPFGGVKASGYGRELGEWGLREFVNVKTVVVSA